MARFGGRIYIWFVWLVGWGIRMALELTYQNISGAEVNFYMLLCLYLRKQKFKLYLRWHGWDCVSLG